MSATRFLLLDSRRHSMRAAPLAQDNVPSTMCRRCGFKGPHAGAADCITALRDRIAVLQFGKRAKVRG